MFNSNIIKDLTEILEVEARFQKRKARIPEGEDARKYMSKKDQAILDKAMKRCFGYGLSGPQPFAPFGKLRKHQKTDATSADGSPDSES